MNHLGTPQMLTSSTGQLVHAAPGMQVNSIMTSMQPPTSAVAPVTGIMSHAGVPMGTIAIPGGATLQALAGQSQNCPMPLNLVQNLSSDSQQNHTTIAQQPQLRTQIPQQQQQLPGQQGQQNQQQPLKLDASTVSTFGLGLTHDMALHASQFNPHLLTAVPPGLNIQGQGNFPISLSTAPSTTTSAAGGSDAPPPKKKKKSKKKKVPTSLTPGSSSIPDKLGIYKPNCGESDMEAFMAYQKLCNTHLDLKSKLHLLYNSRHSCQLCHREFKGFCRLKRHLQSHADFRPYKCESCSKRFCNVSKLKRHSLVHSGVKPYKCPLCDSAHSRREHLKCHMLTHSKERPYRCNGCDYSSRKLDGVHKHIKAKHSGEDCKVMYVRPQIFDFLSHDFVMQTVKAEGGDSKDNPGSLIKDPLTDKDAFLQLMMGNIKFSQLLTSCTTNARKNQNTSEGTTKKKKKKKRKASNPTQIKEPKIEENNDGSTKFPEGSMPMTLPLVTASLASAGNGSLLDSQRAIFQQDINRSQSQTPVGESKPMVAGAEALSHPHTPTPQNLVQNQQSGENTGNNGGNQTPHPAQQPSPMPQQFNNFGSTSQLVPQGQQFFPAHIGEQVPVSMQNTTSPVPNTSSAFQSVYTGGTYEPVPPQMVPGKYFGPVPHNSVYETEPFNGVPAGVPGIPPFFRSRIGQGCRQLNDMATFHLKPKQPNFGGHQ